MIKQWHNKAWDEYLYWQQRDKKALKRLNELIRSIERNGYKCTGKPEPLKGELSGWWSVRIDEVNRLVFRITGKDLDTLEIIQCKGHYK